MKYTLKGALALTALKFASLASAEGVLPPSGGKFFYFDLTTGENYGQQSVDVLSGSNDQKLKLWLSTFNHEMAIITTDCPDSQCKIPNKFSKTQSNTYDPIPNSSQSNVATRFLD